MPSLGSGLIDADEMMNELVELAAEPSYVLSTVDAQSRNPEAAFSADLSHKNYVAKKTAKQQEQSKALCVCVQGCRPRRLPWGRSSRSGTGAAP